MEVAPPLADLALDWVGLFGGVTLRQLRYFIAVVEARSFTAAALELSVAQPSLSRQIGLLERTVGGRLLDRNGHGVTPTLAGELLLPKAYAALRAAGDGTSLAQREIRHPSSVCIVVVPGAPSAIVAGAVSAWRQAHPTAEVQWIEVSHGRRVAEKVADGASVVGIRPPVAPWTGSVVTLMEEPLASPDPCIRHPACRCCLRETASSTMRP